MQSQAELIIFSSQKFKAIPVVKFAKDMYQDVILSGQGDEDWLKAYDRVLDEKEDADITLEDEVLCYKVRPTVSDGMDLRKIIVPGEYDSKVAVYIGKAKTIELVE